MRQKQDMRNKKKLFETRKKLSKCYGSGSHVYRFTEKKQWICR